MACIDPLQPGFAYLYPLKDLKIISFQNISEIVLLFIGYISGYLPKGIELVSDAPLLHIFFPRTFSIINTRAID